MNKQRDPKADMEEMDARALDEAWEKAWEKAWAAMDTPSVSETTYLIAKHCFMEGAKFGRYYERKRWGVSSGQDVPTTPITPPDADKWAWTGQWATTQPTATRAPHRCPVCGGCGVVAWPEQVTAGHVSASSSIVCSACCGKGVLWS